MPKQCLRSYFKLNQFKLPVGALNIQHTVDLACTRDEFVVIKYLNYII